jgi:hypothetical protein
MNPLCLVDGLVRTLSDNETSLASICCIMEALSWSISSLAQALSQSRGVGPPQQCFHLFSILQFSGSTGIRACPFDSWWCLEGVILQRAIAIILCANPAPMRAGWSPHDSLWRDQAVAQMTDFAKFCILWRGSAAISSWDYLDACFALWILSCAQILLQRARGGVRMEAFGSPTDLGITWVHDVLHCIAVLVGDAGAGFMDGAWRNRRCNQPSSNGSPRSEGARALCPMPLGRRVGSSPALPSPPWPRGFGGKKF